MYKNICIKKVFGNIKEGVITDKEIEIENVFLKESTLKQWAISTTTYNRPTKSNCKGLFFIKKNYSS